MSTTELSELEALLEKMLPDPRGFAERVFQQLTERLSTDPRTESGTVVDSYDTEAYDALVDRNVLLAAAVGACECWGYDPDCVVCRGAGSAGWVQPDARLFTELIEPAIRRRPAPTSPADDAHDDEQPEEGDGT